MFDLNPEWDLSMNHHLPLQPFSVGPQMWSEWDQRWESPMDQPTTAAHAMHTHMATTAPHPTQPAVLIKELSQFSTFFLFLLFLLSF